jgi:MFS family permease
MSNRGDDHGARSALPTMREPGVSLEARLDRLRWSRLHTTLLLALGIGWLFDALEVNLFSSFINPIDDHFHVGSSTGQYVLYFWLLGIMVGAVVGGRLADRFGRRRLFIVTLLWYAIFSALTSLSPSISIVMVLRFVAGLGVGAEYSIINAAICEFMPAFRCGRACAAVINFWPLGAILAGLLAVVLLNVLSLGTAVSWRYGFLLGGVLSLGVLFFRRRLPESPRWLASQGRTAEAEAIVQRLEAQAGISTEEAAEVPTALIVRGPLRSKEALVELLRRYPGRLALGATLDLSEGFGFYGMFAFMPLIVFPAIKISNGAIPYFYIVGNVGALSGGITMTLMFDWLGRKRTVIGFYTAAAAVIGLLAAATNTKDAAIVLLAFVVVNAISTGAWTSAYPTFTELFPTHLRAAGVGFSVGVGRFGAAFGVLLLTYVANHLGITAGYLLVAGFWLIGAAAMSIWAILGGVEASGRSLESLVSPRTSPSPPLEQHVG